MSAIKYYISSLLVLTLLSVSTAVKAVPDAFCGYLSDPPEFPQSTVMHIFVWDFSDTLIYNRAVTSTEVFPPPPPPTTTVTNNPRFTAYFLNSQPDRDLTHGVTPSPVAGLWFVEGDSVMFKLTTNPFTYFQHPDSPFVCDGPAFAG